MVQSSSAPSHKHKLVLAVVIIVILAAVVLAIWFLAPNLISGIGGGTALFSLNVPGGEEFAPSSPLEDIDKQSNPFEITNPFKYESPFE